MTTKPEKTRLSLLVHEDVLQMLTRWIDENRIDISLSLLLRFLMSLGYREINDGWFERESREAIAVMDMTYRESSDEYAVNNGRVKVYLTSTVEMLSRYKSPEFAYQCIMAALFSQNIGLEELALEYIDDRNYKDYLVKRSPEEEFMTESENEIDE